MGVPTPNPATDPDGLTTVRWYTIDDPVYADVDNRPPVDLWQRDRDLKALIDAIVPGATVHNDLTSRQGGSATESYHLLSAEYSAVNGANSPGAGNVFQTANDVANLPTTNQKAALVGPGSYPPTVTNYFETKDSVAALISGIGAGKVYEIYSAANSTAYIVGAGFTTIITIGIPTPPTTHRHFILAGTYNFNGGGQFDIFDGTAQRVIEASGQGITQEALAIFAVRNSVTTAITYSFRLNSLGASQVNYLGLLNANWIMVIEATY